MTDKMILSAIQDFAALKARVGLVEKKLTEFLVEAETSKKAFDEKFAEACTEFLTRADGNAVLIKEFCGNLSTEFGGKIDGLRSRVESAEAKFASLEGRIEDFAREIERMKLRIEGSMMGRKGGT